jgi:hypothetical protein
VSGKFDSLSASGSVGSRNTLGTNGMGGGSGAMRMFTSLRPSTSVMKWPGRCQTMRSFVPQSSRSLRKFG